MVEAVDLRSRRVDTWRRGTPPGRVWVWVCPAPKPDLGDAKLVTLTPAKIRQWHTALGDGHPTRNAHCYALLHATCATAVQDEVLDANPCRIRAAMQTTANATSTYSPPPKSIDSPPRCPSGCAPAWCWPRGAGCGGGTSLGASQKGRQRRLRRVACASAVTYRSGEFLVGEPKTAAGVRDVVVPPHIRPVLKAHLKNHVGASADELLFPTDDGGHMHGDNYRTPWEKAREAISKPNLRVHDLRHVGAVLAAQSGATTAELMHRLAIRPRRWHCVIDTSVKAATP